MKTITVNQYAANLGVSRQAVMKAIQQGKLDAFHQSDPDIPKGRWYVRLAEDETSPSPDDATYAPTPAPAPEHHPLDREAEAQLFAQLLEEIDRRLERGTSKSQVWVHIHADYNSRALIPDLHRLKGDRSERALRHWHARWLDSGRDMYALIHRNSSTTRGRRVTQAEQDYLFAHLLQDKRLSILSVIHDLKANSAAGLIDSPTSASTLKRWIQDWVQANPDLWAQARQGSKYVKDNIVKSIMRDTSMIGVGDVLVIDGHTLAFDVINPVTGKPARLTLILLIDWASRYPVGAALAATESSQHVLTAVRNAILHLGMIPKFILFDNGKAFRSKLFHSKWEDHDLSREFAGIFPRLGIEAEFAEAYNARTKIIERFFRTMQEQFERFQSTFRGRNIDDKPANLSRNETWAQSLFSGRALQYNEALDLTYYYFRHVYGVTPHRGLSGRPPVEIFEARVLDPARQIPTERLNYLMLRDERKRLRSEGIWLNKCRYYHDSLVKYVGQQVIIRYDYSDLRWILVYDAQNRYICQASLRESQHAFVSMEKDNPLAHQKLVAELRANKRARKSIEVNTAALVKSARRGLASALAGHAHLRAEILAEISESNPTFKQPPLLQPPVDPEAAIEVVARLADRARQEELAAAPDPSGKVIDVAEPVHSGPTLADILKRRGISIR